MNDTLDALVDERRRTLLQVLATYETEEVDIHELAAELVASEAGSAGQRERIVIELHHNLLPRLDDAGFVAYDVDRNVVEPNESIDSVRSLLEMLAFKREQ